jgi:hypothetical protein
MGEMRNAHRILVGTPERINHQDVLEVDVDIIKIVIRSRI